MSRTASSRIVLADDKAERRALLESILAPGYRVEPVADRAALREALSRGLPDLLLLGAAWWEPDGLGPTCTDLDCPGPAAPPVILLIAQDRGEQRPADLDAAVTDVLVWPCSPRELLLRVANSIELLRLRAETRRREQQSAAVKNAEAALRSSERRLRLAQRAAGTAAWEYDPIARRADWTTEAYDFFGVDSREPDPAGVWRARIHPEDRQRAMPGLSQFLNRDRPLEFEFRYLHPKLGLRWILSHGGVIEEDGRQIIVGLSLDVTDRRAADQEREQLLSAERVARAEAEAATRTKDIFLATLSHELRTPLSVIVSWSRILQQRFAALDEHLAKGLAIIVKNALAQSQLISDLLDMSRIVSGKLTLAAEPVDLNELVVEAVNSQRPAADAKGLALSVETMSLPAIVLGDPTRLHQVLWNLLTNAIKFTPQGGSIAVILARPRDRIEITVDDTGQGIAPDFLRQLFDPFRQGESGASRRHGGLGLGLAIVKQIVELHGGEVQAHSAGDGHGATFTVRLPAHGATTADAADSGGWPASSEPLEPNLLAGLAVLAVEDQPDMLDYVRRVLEEQGAHVVTASSGSEALDALRFVRSQGGVDLLLADIGMPGMDGYEFIRHVRHTLGIAAEDLPAVALTAFARDEDRVRALEAGFQAHLAKPYHVAQLVTVIHRVRRPRGA